MDLELEFYKKVLKKYNIYIEDELIINQEHRNYCRKSVLLIDRLNKLESKKLEEVELVDNNKLKKTSKLIIFIITQSYINSSLFLNDWQEAKRLNKEIIILLRDNLINLETIQEQFQCFKYFIINRSMTNNWYNSRLWTFIDLPNESNFYNFIAQLKLKIEVCLCFH